MMARDVIAKILADNNLNPSQLARILGIHPTRIYDLQSGKIANITEKLAKNIVEHFPIYSKAWLMSGEGNPISAASNTVTTGNISGSGNQIFAGNNNRPMMQLQPKQVEPEEIPIKETVVVPADIVNRIDYDIKLRWENGTLEAREKPTQDVVPAHNMKVYTETDEMEPEIGPNDPIFISFVQSPKEVIAGRMYFVDLYQGAVVRWVFPQPDGRLLLRASNTATPDLFVQPSEVLSVSKVVAILKRPKSMPLDYIATQTTLENRDNQINEMLSQQSRLIGIIEKTQK